MNKILVVSVNWLGDVIFSSPVFAALRDRYPQSRIVCLAIPRVHGILAHVPGIDEVITYDERGRHRWPWGKLGLIRELKGRGFDAVFLLHGSKTRAWMMKAAGVPVRVGLERKGRERYLTHSTQVGENDQHRSDRYLHVIEHFGIAVGDRGNRLLLPLEEAARQRLLEGWGISPEDRVVVLNPGGNWDLKRWPEERFVRLGQALRDRYPQYRLFLTGETKDADLAARIAAKIDPPPVNLAGATTLDELMVLLHRADVVISADSGPVHIANALGTDVIAIFGPTRPEITGPRGVGGRTVLTRDVGCNRIACYHLQCPENTCMRAVTVSSVLCAVGGILT